MSLCHDLDSILPCHIYCAPPGHFLFLQVSESNSLHEASIQSSYFPAPVSTAACQVSYLDRQSHLINVFLFPAPCVASNSPVNDANSLLKLCLFFCADAFLSVPVWGL